MSSLPDKSGLNPSVPLSTTTNREPSGSVQVEFAVHVDKLEDLNKISLLLSKDGYRLLSADFESKTIKLELENRVNEQIGSVRQLQEFIEKETGFLAVIKGVGELASTVTELRPSENSIREGSYAHGVVRLSQLADNLCYVDASVSGGNHKLSHLLSLAIHEFGNLEGCGYESIGDEIVKIEERIVPAESSITVSKTIPNCHVAEMIGRSIALSNVSSETREKTIISAGVVARASTVQQNKKQVCSCSGKTLWEERIDRKKSEQQTGQ